MLTIKELHKSFGNNIVLDGLNLDLEQGKIYTLVGGNGSGKTTLFNILTGFLKTESGRIIFNKNRIDNLSPEKITNLGLTRTFQDLRLIKQLSVKNNLLLSLKNNPGEKLRNALLPQKLFKKEYQSLEIQVQSVLDEIQLRNYENQLASDLSYGQQKLLTIGCAITNNAELLLLDEPIAGIDKKNYKRIVQIIRKLKNKGLTIFQIEHDHKYIEELSDFILFINNGKIQQFNKYAEFSNNTVVRKEYFIHA